MAPVTMPTPELDFGKSAENCVTDGLIKFGGGLALGSVFSLLFFKRRRWPIILGGGFGIGIAWANCSKDFNRLTASSRPKAV
ncbi:MICOS complex subunit Mic10-like isoform X2 [Cloeon dipterum]|uniref:MICOS complex subunit Mic10-like isoform X2 n=1 Tax=Cloeon dipterum TaxID=197152 RepID=UPI00321FAB32